MAGMEDRIDLLETDLMRLRNDLRQAMQGLEAQKEALTDVVNLTFTQQKLIMEEIIGSARKEFDQLRTTMTEIARRSEQGFQMMDERLGKLEAQPRVLWTRLRLGTCRRNT